MAYPTFNYAARIRDANVASVNQRLAMGDFMGSPSYRAVLQKTGPRGVHGRADNVRNILMNVGGVGSFNAEMLIPQMFLSPRTTDPDAQATILTVEGVQRALNRVGAKLDVSGLLDPMTVLAINKVSGASWMAKTWLQIYGDLAEMINRGKKIAPGNGALGALGDVVLIDAPTPPRMEFGDVFTTIPLATIGAGALLLYLALK